MATEKTSIDKSGQRAEASRRDFLRGSAATVLGATVVSAAEPVVAQADEKTRAPHPANPLPPQKELPLPGVHGYAEKSLAAGERLHLRISADVEYRLSIRRLGPKVDDRDRDEIIHRFAVTEARLQPIHPGSYVNIAQGLDADRALDALTLECWLRPWVHNRRQGIVTQLDDADGPGIGLLLTAQSELLFHCGVDRDSGKPCTLTTQMPAGRTWRHCVATWDGKTARLFLDGKPAAEASFNALVQPHKGPLRLGASGSDGTAVEFLDGDLAALAIYSNALTNEAVTKRFTTQGLMQPSADASLVACWPLDEERGATIRDASDHGHDGQIINRGTWMIGGPSFDGEKVPRFGDYDPDADPTRGHGLRLASDDLYDCRWEVTQTFDVPADAKPGLYTAEAEFEREGKPYRYPITFVVRRSKTRHPADILVLAATSTWTAYSGTPFGVNTNGPQSWGTGGIKNSHEAAPSYCCYRNHRHGQPTYQIGLNMPWPVAGPEVLYSPQQVGYSHLARADRFLMAWLETEGIDFDVCSDHDLHRWPQLLEGRKIVFINGHSEYWSSEACESTDAYLRRGGSLIVLSGNSMLWRTSFDDEVMECRKFDDRIGGRQFATIGELYHTHDHRRGSLLRECGSPSWKVIGLEADGWSNTGAIAEFLPYHVTDENHPLLTTPTPTNLRNGDTFGAAEGDGPRAIGHEWDVRVPRIVAMTKSKEGATMPEEPPGIQTLAVGKRDSGVALDYLGHYCKFVDGICAEFIDWKRPEGGRVINFGSIGVGWALAGDPKLQTILRNAMHACGFERRARRNA